jgi:hypothetical protein
VNPYFTCPSRALNLFSFTFPGALPPGIPKQGFQPEEYNPDSATALSHFRLSFILFSEREPTSYFIIRFGSRNSFFIVHFALNIWRSLPAQLCHSGGREPAVIIFVYALAGNPYYKSIFLFY